MAAPDDICNRVHPGDYRQTTGVLPPFGVRSRSQTRAVTSRVTSRWPTRGTQGSRWAERCLTATATPCIPRQCKTGQTSAGAVRDSEIGQSSGPPRAGARKPAPSPLWGTEWSLPNWCGGRVRCRSAPARGD